MRIGINLLFMIPGIVGGTETYAKALLWEISQIDKTNEYILFLNSESSQLVPPSSSNIKQVVLPINAKSRLKRYVTEQLLMPFLAVKYRLDLLHSLGYVSPLILPCPSVVTIHDLNYINLGNEMDILHRKTLGFFVPQSAKRANHVITVSKFSKQQIVNHLNIPSEKVTVTYNATRKRKVLSDREWLKYAEDMGIDRPYIMGLSSSSPHKNLITLVRAFRNIVNSKPDANLQLIIAGREPRNKDALISACKEFGIENRVVFTGYVADDILTLIYKNALAFVFPSIYEGFGIPIVEAYDIGVPVICSNAAAIPEVAGDAAIFVDPNDVDGFSKAIIRLLDDIEMRSSMVVKGRKQALQFNWKKTAEQTLEVYKSIRS